VIFPALSDLVAFLMRDCCEGHCAVCDKAIALFAKCTGRPTRS
jgi:ArsR family transcriptional regulator, arsenate/arsenite/antimonite-responsive transcriptional repressor